MRRLFVSACIALLLASFPASAQDKSLQGKSAQDKKVPKIALVAASKEYEPEKSLAILRPLLEKEGFVCVSIVWKNDTDIPGLERLGDCDAMVLFARRVKLSGDQLERFKKYCTSGKPIVGIRTASHAIQTWLDLDAEVLGGNYKGHYGEGPKTQVAIVEKAKKHPILEGFQPFESVGTLYKNEKVAADCEVLLTGSIPDHAHPVAWTRTYRGGRIFYTSLGHQEDFRNESFLRLLTNAVKWSVGRD